MPDEIGSDSSNGESLKKLFEEVDPARLRQLVLQAVAISPLISLVPLDLAKGPVICPEETLVVSGDLPLILLSKGTLGIEHETLGESKTAWNP